MDSYFHSSSPIVTANNINTMYKKAGEKTRNKTNNKMIQLSTDPQIVAARERRNRISEKFKILKSMIPGTDSRNMDTVSMLEEAIQYVKYLKSQIWLHQTMICFDNNFDDYDYDYDHQVVGSRNYSHQDDNLIYGDYNYHQLSSLPQMEHDKLPHQLRFSNGSCYKVEGEENIYGFSFS